MNVSRVIARLALLGILSLASYGCGSDTSESKPAAEPVDTQARSLDAPAVDPVDAWSDLLAAGLAELDQDRHFSKLLLATLRDRGADAVPLRELLAVTPEGAHATYGQELDALLEKRYPSAVRRLGASGSGRIVELILEDMVHEEQLWSITLHVPAFNEAGASEQPFFSPGVEVGDDLIYGYRRSNAGGELEAREISEAFARRTPVIVIGPDAAGPQRAPKFERYSAGVFEDLRARGLVLKDPTPREAEQRPRSLTALQPPSMIPLVACGSPAINPLMDWFIINQKWENIKDGKPEVYYSFSPYSWSGPPVVIQEDYIMQSVDVGQKEEPGEIVDTAGCFCDSNPYLWLTIYEYDWYTSLKALVNSINGVEWVHKYKARYASEVYYDNAFHSDPVNYYSLYPNGDLTLYGTEGTFHLKY